MKREELDLVVGDVIELAGGPRLVRRTSRQTPSADWTLSSMKMHLQSASAQALGGLRAINRDIDKQLGRRIRLHFRLIKCKPEFVTSLNGVREYITKQKMRAQEAKEADG